MSSVLVTGANGNVGTAVTAALRGRGAEVREAVRTTSTAGQPQRVRFDFGDGATFSAALEGVDSVFLMRPPQMSQAKSMRPFIEAMRAASVAHVVFLSVQGAGTNLFVPHHAIEKYLRKSGVPWTFLRPSFFMQNLSITHRAEICARDEIFVPAGNGRTNFIDVADIGEAAAIVLTTPGHLGKAYELTGSEALSYDQIAEALSVACGRDIRYARPTGREFKERMLAEGHDEEFVSVMGKIYAIAKFGMAAGTTDDLEQLIGREPTNFQTWAEQNAGCFTAAHE